ncbi:hypothetical protein GQR60_15720 [Labilibaculum sp. A4]|uniref:hypothetical protein n=1 Tax=Labilibaculum euxinus TaxID=2686357 RepID=UPI000F61C679|nr:hypothetical protein [Labilibaculum euxinus]MDQ1771881.1 hypothetical protein [Labilibaculum euxinus]MWN77786.1 hypothetical protein [Labilibaculum euxinus]
MNPEFFNFPYVFRIKSDRICLKEDLIFDFLLNSIMSQNAARFTVFFVLMVPVRFTMIVMIAGIAFHMLMKVNNRNLLIFGGVMIVVVRNYIMRKQYQHWY